ncbi:hypothetical protein PIB30_013332 [Stylosanthes scabra]|uniref:Uncharacterized protein n=1 Tax=Stylosanthes scabra TaxID=79078 RepID=A0ABU6U546_9FABA|nr:hypothetical protein [Stylosanthes scabra]
MRTPPTGDGNVQTGVKTATTSGSLSGRLTTLVVEGTGGDEGSSQTGRHYSGTLHIDCAITCEAFVDSIQEDMELYLMRACTKLKVDCPAFEIREHYSYGGHYTVAYTGTLVCAEKEVELEVHGSFVMEEKEARQDACFRLFEKLLVRKGKKIIDFLLLAARQEVTELRRQLATPLVQWLRDVEQQQDNL